MLKRLFDLSFTLAGLILLLPIFLALVLLVWIMHGAPIFFYQMRPGLHGYPFVLVKFRSMTDERKADGELLPDSKRLSTFGRLLRTSSLDELPELINVLKGEMSLVGPRPLLMEYLPLYSLEQARRHEVRPGITGWAQVNGRNSLSWEEKFMMDVWYVDNWSLWLDMKILSMTVLRVLARNGINAEGEATTPRFTGSLGS
jgi:sugar transferase EpsL